MRESRVIPVGEGEAVVCVEPAMVRVTPGAGAVGGDLGLTERLGHVLCGVDHLILSKSRVCRGVWVDNVCCELLDV